MIRSFLLLIAAVTLLAGCNPGPGDRCNPLLFNDVCQGGTQCVYPENCGVAFCCPMGPTSLPNCQSCPAADGGSDGG